MAGKPKKKLWEARPYECLVNKLLFKHTNSTNKKCDMSCMLSHSKPNVFKLNRPFAIRCLTNDRILEDPFTSLVEAKLYHQHRIDRTRIHIQNSQKYRKVDLSAKYLKIQEVLDEEPDEYFSSTYNWYYTGGTLNAQKYEDHVLLYYASSERDLSVMRLKLKHSKWKVSNDVVLCNNDATIYQVCANTCNEDSIVGVRTRNNIYLHKILEDENDSYKSKLWHNLNSDIPFVNLNLGAKNSDEYVTINASQVISVWDINTNTNKVHVTKELDFKGNCFAESAYLNQNVLVFVNTDGFYLYDKRVGNISNTNILLFEKKELDSKPNISGLCVGKWDTVNCYVLTTDSVKHLDIRAKRVSNSWSHHLKEMPFLSTYVRCKGLDTVSISNCCTNDKLMIKHDGTGICIPHQYPNLTDAFETSVLSGYYDREIPVLMKDRLAASTTGLAVVRLDKHSFTMFVANSVGDIFAYPVNSSYEEHDFTPFNKHLNVVSEPLNVADRVCLNKLKLDLTTTPNIDREKKLEKINSTLEDLKQRSFKCSEHISAWWEDDVDEERSRTLINGIEEVNASTNVEQWLSHMSNVDSEND